MLLLYRAVSLIAVTLARLHEAFHHAIGSQKPLEVLASLEFQALAVRLVSSNSVDGIPNALRASVNKVDLPPVFESGGKGAGQGQRNDGLTQCQKLPSFQPRQPNTAGVLKTKAERRTPERYRRNEYRSVRVTSSKPGTSR